METSLLRRSTYKAPAGGRRWTRRKGGRQARTHTRAERDTRAHACTSARADASRDFPGICLPFLPPAQPLSSSPRTERKRPAGLTGAHLGTPLPFRVPPSPGGGTGEGEKETGKGAHHRGCRSSGLRAGGERGRMVPLPPKRGRRKKVTGSLRRGGGRDKRRHPPEGKRRRTPRQGGGWLGSRPHFCPALDIARGNGRRAGGRAAAAKVWSLGGAPKAPRGLPAGGEGDWQRLQVPLGFRGSPLALPSPWFRALTLLQTPPPTPAVQSPPRRRRKFASSLRSA